MEDLGSEEIKDELISDLGWDSRYDAPEWVQLLADHLIEQGWVKNDQ